MKLTKLDFSVAILAGISCLLMYIQVPVWAVFVGWAWYFALGCTKDLLVKGILPSIVGAVLAIAAFLLIDAFSGIMPGMVATIVSVIITVFVLMLTLKVPVLNHSLMSFNAYSCMFVGYSAGTYMVIDGMPALLNAMIWITGGNYLGLVFGVVSIFFGSLGAKKTSEESAELK